MGNSVRQEGGIGRLVRRWHTGGERRQPGRHPAAGARQPRRAAADAGWALGGHRVTGAKDRGVEHSQIDSAADAYARAGVDLDAADRAKLRLRDAVRATHGPQVLGLPGGFGGLFALGAPDVRDPVLVSSIDGVGTKLKLAFALNRHESIGADLVAHCVNDILVCGAQPLFFLDYPALAAIDPEQALRVLEGV